MDKKVMSHTTTEKCVQMWYWPEKKTKLCVLGWTSVAV